MIKGVRYIGKIPVVANGSAIFDLLELCKGGARVSVGVLNSDMIKSDTDQTWTILDSNEIGLSAIEIVTKIRQVASETGYDPETHLTKWMPADEEAEIAVKKEKIVEHDEEKEEEVEAEETESKSAPAFYELDGENYKLVAGPASSGGPASAAAARWTELEPRCASPLSDSSSLTAGADIRVGLSPVNLPRMLRMAPTATTCTCGSRRRRLTGSRLTSRRLTGWRLARGQLARRQE